MANGFLAQLTAQALDFTILAIVLLTFLTVTGFTTLPDLSAWRKKLFVCGSTWIFPLSTSTAAASMGMMQPVDRNWCWIPASRLDLRYALVQSWWLAIIFLTIFLFIWWLFYLRLAPFFSALWKAVGGEYVQVEPTSPGPKGQGPSDAGFLGQSEGKRHSEFSLPIQGKKRPTEGRRESLSRWIYVRQPGVNNSYTSCPRAAAERLCPVPRSFDVPQPPSFAGLPPLTSGLVDSDRETAPTSLGSIAQLSPSPRYHNQCPRVAKSFSVSVGSPIAAPSTASSGTLPQGNPGPGARHHYQYPKIARSIGLSSSASAPRSDPTPPPPPPPLPPALTLRADGCNNTTLIYSPPDPWPSPVPGLPPPPWTPSNAAPASSGGGDHPSRRRTFLFSKSTWSESTPSRRVSSAPAREGSAGPLARDHRRALLLAAYPLAYVVLSLPAVVQCFLEARGGTGVSPRVDGALVGTAQYVGLANAVTFAVAEGWRWRRTGDRPGGWRDGVV